MKRTVGTYFAVACALAVSAAHAQNLGVSTACGTAAGTRFNLEPRTNPLPQNQTALDFLPGAASGGDLVVGVADDMRQLTSGSGTAPDYRGLFGLSSQTGFYVHRNGADASPCTPDLEGGLGPLVNSADGNALVGVGYAAVAADATSQTFFIVDTRVGEGEGSDSALGLFRTTAANLIDTSVCPYGTLSESQSAQCWPTAVLINVGSVFTGWNSSPHLAVDQRPASSAVGASDVYVSATQFVNSNGIIVVTACRNNLSACSTPVRVSGNDSGDLSHVAVRPDGGVTITYVVQSGGAGAL